MLTSKCIAAVSATVSLALAHAPVGVTSPQGEDRTFTHRGMIVTLRLEDADLHNQMHGYWGGGDAGRTTIMKSAMVKTNDSQYSLHRSSFADLADPHTVYSYTLKNDFIILIEGGDASESYDSKLIFRHGELVKRIVASGELPHHHREETVYTNKDPGG